MPWELIGQSLTGSLTDEEKLQLQQWLSSADGNRQKYEQLKEMWINGMRDYMLYKEADEKKSWDLLRSKLNVGTAAEAETTMVDERSGKRSLHNILAVAAVFLGLVAIGIVLFLSDNRNTVYESFATEEKRVVLKDGSLVILKPRSKIEVSDEFDKSSRTINMVYGEAYFDVVHLNHKPFVVTLGETQVKDIGTSFTILKNDKEIKVAVESGKVEFSNLDTKEAKTLSAGSKLTYHVDSNNFGKIEKIETRNGVNVLHFDNTPLSEAIFTIQKVYNTKITVHKDIADRKLTAQLDGLPYDTVIKVVCKTLGLDYSIRDGQYILKDKE